MEAIDQPTTGESSADGTSPADPARGLFPFVTIALMVLSAASTGLWLAFPNEVNAWLYATDVELWQGTKLWSLLTASFLHVDFLHLAFNCYWLWRFGPVIEQKVTRVRYVTWIVLTTLFVSLAEFAVSGQTGVGMSGMVYGLFGYMLVQRDQHPAFRRVMTASTIMLLLGWLILCFALTHWHIMSVANVAHLGGLIAGLLSGIAAGGRRFGKAAVAALCVTLLGSAVPLIWAPWHDNWHFVRAMRALEKNDQANALIALEYYHERHPENVWAAQTAASIRIQQKDYDIARQRLLRTLNSVHDAMIANSLAWLLATCPEERLRNGRRAVEIAQQACESTDWENASYLDTLAAAYAESGDFAAALKWSGKAVELSNYADREALQKNYRSFQNKQPVREP
jgi:membrane associated rhomboid family serine protease